MLKNKIYIVVLAFAMPLHLFSQFESDAIRLSMQSLGSTARSYGIGGAFGAVGADPSAAAINPAGLARFRTSKFFLSSSFYNAKNKTTYGNSEFSNSKFNFNLPNFGFVANIRAEGYEDKKPEGMVNFVFGFNMNRIANFHKSTTFEGNSKISSITQNWAERATDDGVIAPQFSKYSIHYLAFQTWAIDADSSSSIPAYKSAYGTNAIDVNQSGTVLSSGSINDYNISLAGNYKHVFHGGISIGIRRARYKEEFSFTERDNKNNTIKDIQSVNFESNLLTRGNGFNAKIGFIATPTEYIRIGYAYHSPTLYNLTDSYFYSIESKYDFGAKNPFGFNRENTYLRTEPATYKYSITTPSRNVFSLALVNKEIGFISIDAETVNYANARMKAKDYAFKDENLSLSRNYNNVVNLRLGAELMKDEFRFRAGYARYPSPYKEGYVPYVKDLVNNIYTLGFGIKLDEYAIDLAYVNSGYADYTVPYQLKNGQYFTATNNVRANNFIISATINID